MNTLVSRRNRTLVPWVLALAFCSGAAHAANCELTIDANDMIQFNSRALQVDPACSAVQLTLRHVGKQEAHVLGHDWVLARSSDVSALANAGMAAGAVQEEHRRAGGRLDHTRTDSIHIVEAHLRLQHFDPHARHDRSRRCRARFRKPD